MIEKKFYICVQNGACKAYFSIHADLILYFGFIKDACRLKKWNFDEILEYFADEDLQYKNEDYVYSDAPFMIYINCKKEFISTYHIPSKFKTISQIIIAPNEV